ncbi:DOMON-like domain-containing protein [Rhodoplanes roseus]|uniref:DOMON-like domain-containing protein n=1 Tax=Rhodoplanes roseus TaxID=29409 RepID=A0A327L983_9BRAD|nr:DOMON-like domain-containing protein [Rhodoplanes roseus]RAI46082.1 hypothetical protein CH341_00515 [Rhodoplanes roseus]
MRLPLHAHPDSPGPADTRIAVEVVRPAPGRLALAYEVTGRIAAIRWPAPAAPVRTDGLWRHTCLEAFLAPGPAEAYLEINLSPSTAWAVYRFDSYRSGMRAADALGAPAITPRAAPDRFVLAAVLDLAGLPELDPRRPWRLGLSAVIEDTEGRVSYWALAHPPGAPDFHHAAGFAHPLPPCT